MGKRRYDRILTTLWSPEQVPLEDFSWWWGAIKCFRWTMGALRTLGSSIEYLISTTYYWLFLEIHVQPNVYSYYQETRIWGLILCTEIISVHLDVNTRGKDPGTCSFIYISRRASSTKRTLRLLGLPWSMEFGICYLVRTMIGGLSWKHDLRASMKTDILELWK